MHLQTAIPNQRHPNRHSRSYRQVDRRFPNTTTAGFTQKMRAALRGRK